MSNIKVSELKKYKKEFCKEIKTIEVGGFDIEIKKYLPIEKKIELATVIYESCKDAENGLLLVNDNSKEIAKVYFITKYYTNIGLPKNILTAYDLLIETEIYKTIRENISEEINRVEIILENIIQNELDKFNQQNSIQYILKNTLDTIIEKFPTVDETAEQLKKFDQNKLKFVQRAIDFNNGVEK